MVLTLTVDKSLPRSEVQPGLVLGNADRAFIYMMNTLAWELGFRNVLLPSSNLTIIDIGSYSMTYGLALEQWAEQQAKEVRLIAVDPEYASQHGRDVFFPLHASSGTSRIEQLASYVEDALPKLRQKWVEKVDMVTLFNPNPTEPLPDISSLGELCRCAPVMGSVDFPSQDSIDHLVNGLSRQGYKVTTFTNLATPYMKAKYPFDFNPLFVALPK